MNSLPGNDHAAVSKFRTEGLHEWQAGEGMTDATLIGTAIDANTEANLALAFEQRTANLINLMRLQSDYVQAGMGMTSEAAEAVEQRLGLGGKGESNG